MALVGLLVIFFNYQSVCVVFSVQNDYEPSIRVPIKPEFSISSSHYAIQHLLLRKLLKAFA